MCHFGSFVSHVKRVFFPPENRKSLNPTCFFMQMLLSTAGCGCHLSGSNRKSSSLTHITKNAQSYLHSERSTHTSRPRFCKYVESNLNQPHPQHSCSPRALIYNQQALTCDQVSLFDYINIIYSIYIKVEQQFYCDTCGSDHLKLQ